MWGGPGGDQPRGSPEESWSDEERTIEEDDDHEFPPLTAEQLDSYYKAQIAWRECAMGEGLGLPEPPSLEEFAAEGGSWSVGAEVTDDDWNRLIMGDGPGEGQVGRRCGEPPVPHDFVAGRQALARLQAWQVTVVACLDDQGFPLDTIAPPLEEFIEAAGTNWAPAREFHARYGFPDGPAWDVPSPAAATPIMTYGSRPRTSRSTGESSRPDTKRTSR